MKKFNLQDSPESYQLNVHISNLILTYSKPEVRTALVLLDVGLESMNSLLVLRLEQLKAFYGLELFTDVLFLFGIENWKTIDFSQDDAI